MSEEIKYPPFDINIPRMGYFLLYKRKKKDWLGDKIEKKQLKEGFIPDHACYTHVECSGGGCHSINISPPISKLIDITKVHKDREICITRYKDDTYKKKRYKVAYFSASLCNKGYDVLGLLSFVFRWIKHSNRLYFCSEGCAWSLQQEYPSAFDNELPSTIMPAHFLLPNFFEIVWKGIIK